MITKYLLAGSLLLASPLALFAQTEEPDTLSSIYGDLDELVITARKEIVKSDGAKLTYDMEQDDSSKGQSVLDALRKVPMVTVDGQDNIYIKGSKNFRVYVNGKEEPMITANASTVLKAMPSESVSKIEVITEPGAKYDAEGSGGIINLITERRQTKNGYTGSVSLNYSAQNAGASAYGRVKQGKVTASANINYANNSLQKQSSNSEQETINYNSDEAYRQLATMRQRFTFNYVGANLNLSWEPTDRDLISFGAELSDIDAKVKALDNNISMFSRSGVLQYSTLQKISGSMINLGTGGNVSYRRSFNDEGHNITAGYRFNFGRNPWDLDYTNSVEAGDYETPDYEKNRNNTYQREHTATIDYSNPIGDGKHLIEAGAKGIFRRNSATTAHYTGDSFATLFLPEDEYSVTNQIQDVYALYASYTGTFGKWNVKGGLRYEHTYMGLDFLTGDNTNFRRNLDDVVPNAAITYMFGPAINLRLAYQMRISRPGISQMNPAVFQLTQNMAQSGNPDLESERYNNISLTYSNWGQVIGGNIGIDLFQSNNTIERFTELRDNVLFETYGNFGTMRRVTLNGYLNWNITSKMTLGVNGSVDFTSIKSGKSDLRNHGWNGNYGANWSYRGPWNMKYSVYGGQATGAVQLQGDYSGWYYYGVGISKSFLKDDALTLTVNASNFLTKNMDFKSAIHGEGYTTRSTWSNRSWDVGVSISWNFGHLQDQVKKTGADMDNDDTKASSKGGGGIGL